LPSSLPRLRTASFVSNERRLQTAYFEQFDPASLLEGWPYRLRREHWALNLAPMIRETAAEYFRANGIQWHTHANHALSSQVCCVNFLMPLARRPEMLAKLVQTTLGDEMPVMQPVERASDGTKLFVGFEWIGGNYLNEAGKSGVRSRGANATSADAVLKFKRAGRCETLLIEWKYTESYGPGTSASGNATRSNRYRNLAFAPNGPIKPDLELNLEDFFYEPFYQLLRQQMLAFHMQQAREDGADRVSVLHISPSGNSALHKVTSPAMRRFGDDAFAIWPKLLVDPTTFVSRSTEAVFGPLLASAANDDWSSYLLQRYGSFARAMS
jgi:hypothetical protein